MLALTAALQQNHHVTGPCTGLSALKSKATQKHEKAMSARPSSSQVHR